MDDCTGPHPAPPWRAALAHANRSEDLEVTTRDDGEYAERLDEILGALRERHREDEGRAEEVVEHILALVLPLDILLGDHGEEIAIHFVARVLGSLMRPDPDNLRDRAERLEAAGRTKRAQHLRRRARKVAARPRGYHRARRTLKPSVRERLTELGDWSGVARYDATEDALDACLRAVKRELGELGIDDG